LLLAPPLFAIAPGWTEGTRLALLNLLGLPPAIATVTAILLFDGWLYLLHCPIREFDPDTPILFYSAAAYESDKNEALQAGAQGYITKPSIPGELRQAVTQLISAPRETAS